MDIRKASFRFIDNEYDFAYFSDQDRKYMPKEYHCFGGPGPHYGVFVFNFDTYNLYTVVKYTRGVQWEKMYTTDKLLDKSIVAKHLLQEAINGALEKD